ncbi:MAG: cytidylate kinase-like family protein [Proteobacteria bacterium]|nr:cytidylate kinase-like family protein [Pseudomonadota bacterium]
MWENISSEKSESFIELHFGPKGKDTSETSTKPAITISRAEGAGGLTVASNLADYLQIHTPSHEVWTVFSQHLVAKVLEEHHLHKRIGNFMKEGHKGTLTDAFEEFLGLHPSTWTLVEKTNATILRLAQIGNVILVGRGANVVTSEMQTVFHVRLVGSFEKRIEQAQKVFGLDRKSAINYIKKKDEGRRRYLKDNFDKNIDDPLLYHITINTDLVQYDEAARLIGDEVIRRFKLGSPLKAKGSGSRLT